MKHPHKLLAQLIDALDADTRAGMHSITVAPSAFAGLFYATYQHASGRTFSMCIDPRGPDLAEAVAEFARLCRGLL